MLFVGTSIIHPSTEGVFLLCNILDLLIYSLVIECAIAGVFSVIGYSLIVNGIMVAHIVLASGLILGWTKIFFDKELE